METRPETPIGDSTEAASKLQNSFRNWDRESERHRKHRFSFVLVAIFVGPLAVLALAVQVIAFQHHWFAVVLISFEVLLLGFALAIPFLKLGRSHDRWIDARVRAEVLAREQCLLFAQVGPYLGLTSIRAAEEVGKRLTILERNLGDSAELVKSTHTPAAWRDSLEDSNVSHHEIPDVRHRAREYLQKRVVAQQNWFEKRSHDHENRSRRLENGAKLVLTLALVLAGVHLGTLWPLLSDPPTHPEKPHWEMALAIFALWLPAIGAAIVGYRSALGSQRQALSYKYYAEVMTPFRNELQSLAGVGQTGVQDTLKFRRVVLDVEELLINELRLWWMNMVIKEPHTTA